MIVKKVPESQICLLLLLLEFELSFRLAGWLLTFNAIQLKIISSIPTNLHIASYTMYSIHSFRQQLKYADIWHQKQQLHIFSMFLKVAKCKDAQVEQF